MSFISLVMNAKLGSPLKVVLIDKSIQRSSDMSRMLAEVNCEVIASLNPQHDMLRRIEALQPDIIIIDIDLPDRDILENLRSVQDASPRPMVMFSQDDDGATIRRAVESGVSAYVVDDLQPQRVRPVIEAAIATFQQHQQLQQQLDHTRSELANRKTIDRAKGLLMKQRGIDEPEAYRILRKTAMDKNIKLIDVAENVIAAAELLAVDG